ncbi:MAG: hypothetical protein JST54_12660 [Deltaproteobacteria bacterium]|nr:hypothetical protein [Deltaproteobacteria bacterium]
MVAANASEYTPRESLDAEAKQEPSRWKLLKRALAFHQMRAYELEAYGLRQELRSLWAVRDALGSNGSLEALNILDDRISQNEDALPGVLRDLKKSMRAFERTDAKVVDAGGLTLVKVGLGGDSFCGHYYYDSELQNVRQTLSGDLGRLKKKPTTAHEDLGFSSQAELAADFERFREEKKAEALVPSVQDANVPTAPAEPNTDTLAQALARNDRVAAFEALHAVVLILSDLTEERDSDHALAEGLNNETKRLEHAKRERSAQVQIDALTAQLRNAFTNYVNADLGAVLLGCQRVDEVPAHDGLHDREADVEAVLDMANAFIADAAKRGL